MNEKIKEIEKKLEHATYVAEVRRELDYLLLRINKLEEENKVLEKEWDRLQEVFQVLNEAHIKAETKIEELKKTIKLAEATRDDALGYAKMHKAKAEELTEGIEELIAYGMPSHIEEGLKNLLRKD